VKLLWGTANLFSNPRYMNGASTNPEFGVVAYAGAQLKDALDATIALNGENYVFWGGREGYMSLLNTDMKRELDHFGRFLGMARDYARAQGFKGTFFVEPKPMEPSKHQYDFDAATVIGFLREYGLDKDFKINLETNHATLAGHAMEHEMQVAANAGMLGSMDANRGDYQNAWDTDQFPYNINETVEMMLILLPLRTGIREHVEVQRAKHGIVVVETMLYPASRNVGAMTGEQEGAIVEERHELAIPDPQQLGSSAVLDVEVHEYAAELTRRRRIVAAADGHAIGNVGIRRRELGRLNGIGQPDDAAQRGRSGYG
jgi:hypothetical protein